MERVDGHQMLLMYLAIRVARLQCHIYNLPSKTKHDSDKNPPTETLQNSTT